MQKRDSATISVCVWVNVCVFQWVNETQSVKMRHEKIGIIRIDAIIIVGFSVRATNYTNIDGQHQRSFKTNVIIYDAKRKHI